MQPKRSALSKRLLPLFAISVLVISEQSLATDINPSTPSNDPLNIHSLTSTSPHCVPFQWEADGTTTRAAITIPVSVAGKVLRFQLDTGSPGAILYTGDGSKKPTPERHADIGLGDVHFMETQLTEDNTQSVGDDGIAGTFGLAPLIGRITVIDYPAQRLCVFTDASQPTYSRQPHWINGAISEQKFLLPASVGDRRTRRVIFDTGSSTTTLQLGLQDYLYSTGLKSVANSSQREGLNAWRHTVYEYHNSSIQDVKLGDLNLGRPIVSQNAAYPSYSILNDTRFTGVFGNRLLWDKVIILDLTQRARLGILE